MNLQANGKPPLDDNWIPACFLENQKHFPAEELWKFVGKHIAWSWDGSRIVASGDDLDELYMRLKEAGIPSDRAVFDYVDEYPN